MKKSKMKNRNRIRKVVLAVALSAGLFVSYSFIDEYFEMTKSMDIFTALFKELNIYYVDPVEPNKIMEKAIDNMLSGLDPYTNYIPESEKEDYRYMTTGLYGG